MEKNCPIGVFDSGLGGTSVLQEVARALPHEEFVYLGDVARLPYGTKSPEVVNQYADHCVRYLIGQHRVKAIIVACNTATATALPGLRSRYSVPFFGVVEPGVRSVLRVGGVKRVLIAATSATVQSEAYLKAFSEHNPQILARQVACPLLVPLAEEGWFDSRVTSEVIAHYLEPYRAWEYQALLLGCTHYPLLKPAFEKVVSRQTLICHGASELAAEVASFLQSQGMLRSTPKENGACRFLATDRVAAANPIIRNLFGDRYQFELVDLQ